MPDQTQPGREGERQEALQAAYLTLRQHVRSDRPVFDLRPLAAVLDALHAAVAAGWAPQEQEGEGE